MEVCDVQSSVVRPEVSFAVVGLPKRGATASEDNARSCDEGCVMKTVCTG